MTYDTCRRLILNYTLLESFESRVFKISKLIESYKVNEVKKKIVMLMFALL